MHTIRVRNPMGYRQRMRGARALCIAAVLCTSPSAATAQSRVDTTFVVAANSLLDITVREGGLRLRGTDGNRVELHANGGFYTVREGAAAIVITRTRPNSRERYSRDVDDEAILDLMVPRGVRIVVNATQFNTDIRDIDGDVQVRSTTGDIVLEQLAGRALAETLTGNVVVNNARGGLRATTSSGDIDARGLRSKAILRSTSGSLSVAGRELTEVVLETISGDVTFDGVLAPTGRLHVSTHSGDIALRLPEDMRGSLDFNTHSGELSTSIPRTTLGLIDSAARNTRAPQRLLFGGGGPAEISISTFSGDLRIARRSNRSDER